MRTEDTQEFEAKKDRALEFIGILMVIVMAAVIGALFLMTAEQEAEKQNGRIERSTAD